MGVDAPGSSGLTFGNFKEWTKTCGVRKVQREYEKMAEQARENGRTAMEEMQARGFKDYAAFSKACPEFPVTCWPTEFAELGSGFVLYFHFLAMMGFLFVLLFLLQAPAMYQYSEDDWKVGWQWNRWQLAFVASDTCGCLGKNEGILGPLDGQGQPIADAANQQYGTYCDAWDMALCGNDSNCLFQNPGKWVCRNWCFVGNHCPATPNSESPSMADRHYRGLVKSYSACQQKDEKQCRGFRGGDTTFNEPGTDEGEELYIGKWWLTPGNFGPDQAESALIPTMYTVCVAVTCFGIFLSYQKMVLVDRQVDSDTTAPNDFAVLVRGLPTTATDGKAIAEFFRKHAVRGKEDTEIVKVVIGWDAQEFADRVRELKALRSQKAELPDGDPQHEVLQQQIDKINSDLESSATEKAARLRSSGVVVVIFRYSYDMKACLSRWRSFWARCFYCDAQEACCLPAGNNFWKAGELPRFPIGIPPRPVHKIQIERAPNPGDINWMELGVPQKKRLKMFAKTNAMMFCLICVSFSICYGLNRVQDLLRSYGLDVASDALAIFPALGVGVMNGVLSYAARKLGEKEYHDTITVQEFSQALKMSVGMIINTGGVMYFVDAQPREWYQSGGLVNNAFTMLLINAILPPLFPYIDIGYRIKRTVRAQLTQAKIDRMNEIGSRKPTTPAEEEDLKKVRQDIAKFKKAYAPSPMNETRRYAVALKTSICCLFYMPAMPLLAMVGAMGLFLQYWVDKYLLLRWYHRPAKPASCHMAMFSVKFLKYVAPFGLSITIWLFLTPSWHFKNEVYSNFIICVLISLGFCCIPLSIWTSAFFSLFGARTLSGHECDYYKAQYMWAAEMKYHKDHFMMKPLPESVNPEFLKPGEEAAEEVEAVRASYGVATMQEAAAAGIETARVELRGGKIIKDSIASKPDESTGRASEPLPTVYGAAAVPAVAVAPVGAAPPPVADPPPEPPVLLPAASAGSASEPSGGGAVAVIWEFEVTHGWKPFASDCLSYVEEEYQKFRAGKGKEQINVRTGGKELTLNFTKMTQKLVDSSTIRQVRRREE